jgi:Zn-dependent protease
MGKHRRYKVVFFESLTKIDDGKLERRSLYQMKVFGIPVKVDFTFLLVGTILASDRLKHPALLVEWLFVLFISILIHELGHALVCRAFGLSPQIQLYSMGGLTSWSGDIRISPQKNIAISLAGPFAGFLFFGVVYLSSIYIFPDVMDSEFGERLYKDLMFVNLFWGVVNLLPVLPMDGGHVIESIEELASKKTGGLIAPAFSFIVAAGFVFWAFSTSRLFMAILMGIFVWINLSVLIQRFQAHRDKRLHSPLEHAQESFKQRDGAAVVRQAQEILKSAGSDAVKCSAQQLLVQGLILEKNLEEAKKELIRLQAVYGPDASQQALIGFETDEWPRALPLIEYAYQSSQSSVMGMIYAHALIGAHRFTEAMPLIADPRLAEYATGLYALMQARAFEAGEFDLSADAGALALQRGGGPHIAYNIACAHARAGRIDQALEWIKRAVDAGYSDLDSLKNDPDLEILRNHPEFILMQRRKDG